MNASKTISNNEIWEKTFSLAKRLLKLSDEMPADGLYQLGSRLKNNAELLPQMIIDSLSERRRIDRIRSKIKADRSIEETKDFLTMVQELRYSKTKELMEEIDSLQRIYESFYSGRIA